MVWLFCVLAFLEPGNSVTNRYQAHIQFLADDLLEGRETSFRGQRIAARYLQAQLALIGATPVVIDPENPYFQPFQVEATGLDESSVSMRLIDRGRTYPLFANLDFRLQVFGTGDLDAKAPLVFLGYGFQTDTFNDYEKVKVKGRWVILLEGQPDGEPGSIFDKKWPGASLYRKIVKARDEGALGVILFRKDALKPPASTGPGHRLRLAEEDPGEDSKRGPFPIISMEESSAAKLFGRDYEKFLQRKAAIAVKQTPQSFQLRRRDLQLSFQFTNEVRDTENVVGIIPGSDDELKDEYMVVSAHYDHIGMRFGAVYNGADDNATGTATALMLARDFAENPAKRSLIVLLVSGEESGLLGSKYFVKHSPVPIEKVVANINMDMIGRNKVGEIGVIPSTVEGISSLNQLLEEINGESSFNHTLIKDMDRYHKRSDHYNFTKSGIPAIFFFAGVHDDYHGPNDDWQKLDYEKLSRFYGLLSEFLNAALDMPDRPFFLEVEKEELPEGETP